jgi:hypothetical protein
MRNIILVTNCVFFVYVTPTPGRLVVDLPGFIFQDWSIIIEYMIVTFLKLIIRFNRLGRSL